MPKDVFSARLREALDKSGLTQAQLGEASACSQEDISRYLQGRIPGGARLILIAKALGTTAEDLLRGEPKGPVETIREAFQQQNYARAMEEMRQVKKSLRKLEALLGSPVGIRASKERIHPRKPRPKLGKAK
jgi:transcriptional regulator with XRE-family HTH domain